MASRSPPSLAERRATPMPSSSDQIVLSAYMCGAGRAKPPPRVDFETCAPAAFVPVLSSALNLDIVTCFWPLAICGTSGLICRGTMDVGSEVTLNWPRDQSLAGTWVTSSVPDIGTTTAAAAQSRRELMERRVHVYLDTYLSIIAYTQLYSSCTTIP